MRKTEAATDKIDYTGPSWEDLNQIVGRKSLLAEFEDASGVKSYFRVETLSHVRGRGPFQANCISQRGDKKVTMRGSCPNGHDKPADYKVI